MVPVANLRRHSKGVTWTCLTGARPLRLLGCVFSLRWEKRSGWLGCTAVSSRDNSGQRWPANFFLPSGFELTACSPSPNDYVGSSKLLTPAGSYLSIFSALSCCIFFVVLSCERCNFIAIFVFSPCPPRCEESRENKPLGDLSGRWKIDAPPQTYLLVGRRLDVEVRSALRAYPTGCIRRAQQKLQS